MHLIIDIGNSTVKTALVNNGEITSLCCYEDHYLEDILGIITDNLIQAAIVSSTRNPDHDLHQALLQRIPQVIIFDHNTPTPIKNRYATPDTLGMDRLAAAVGAWSIAPDNDLMIIDLGTAITIDLVSRRGEYLGGNISPGMWMRFAALNHYTQRLPMVDPQTEVPPEEAYGRNTVDAIRNGVIRGIEHEIEGYMAENRDRKIFFTGGDANYFVKSSKNTIFADYELVIKGLDLILEYNAEKNNI